MSVALRSSRCCLCHSKANNNHHEPPKGEVGDHDDTITLCGTGNADGCHGLAHHNGGGIHLVKPRVEGDPWHFIPTDKDAADALTRRRKAHGLPRVQVGFRYCVITVEDCEGLDEAPPSAGEEFDRSAYIRSTATETFRTLDTAIATHWRERAVLIFNAHADLPKADYHEWVTEDCGMSKALASKSRTVVAALGETLGADLDSERQYMAARAVKRGLMSADEAVAQLRSMPLHDFAEKHGLVKPRGPREKTLVCPDCGVAHPISEYEVV